MYTLGFHKNTVHVKIINTSSNNSWPFILSCNTFDNINLNLVEFATYERPLVGSVWNEYKKTSL